MPHNSLRRLLAAAVAAGLMVGALPALPAEPASARGPIAVVAREVRTSVERERTVELPITASHVALHWRGNHDAAVSVAFSAEGRAFDAPTAVEHDEVGEQRGNGETYGAVLPAPGARFVKVTSDRPLPRLDVLALDSDGDRHGAAAGGSAGAVATAAVPQPAVISRAGWGADESLRLNPDGTQKWPPAFHPVQKLVVHHTAGRNADPNPAATVRSIYYYHAITQGWGDIGYNFLVDEAGRIYEGRYSRPYAAGESPTGEDTAGRGVTAAHVSGYNSGTVGIALLGTLTQVDATAGARDAVERMLAWKAQRHGIDPLASNLYTNPVNGTQRTFANISGHRDLAPTECPGGSFYATLPQLRQAVANRIAASGQPSATAPGAATLSVSSARARGVALAWTVPADGGSTITGYRLYRGTGTGAIAILAALGPATTSYRDASVKRGTTYSYTVRAVNAVGEGAPSNTVTATPR